MADHILYPGDVCEVRSNGITRRVVVRDIYPGQGRAMIQIGGDWTLVFADNLRWTGESLFRLPRTRWGWRRLGRGISGVVDGGKVVFR